MERHERQLALDHLAASQERLLELVDGLTAEQWAFRPAEGRWSIGECLEHVMRVENRVFGLIAKKLDEGPAEPEKKEQARAKDPTLEPVLLDRSDRRQAPEPVRPSGEWADSAELVAEFQKTRQRTREFASATEGDLRSYFHPHLALGELDCYQWLLLIGLHTSRHALQIEEIKAAPDFPVGELIAS
jgi:hypothetical protein